MKLFVHVKSFHRLHVFILSQLRMQAVPIFRFGEYLLLTYVGGIADAIFRFRGRLR